MFITGRSQAVRLPKEFRLYLNAGPTPAIPWEQVRSKLFPSKS
ncbi:MAG: AbrB/MazE/SpoVT family DNA-binding domain-containing protein [Acidithiobacillaceae bacterium]|nr:AbrB/MazE/SpoVT family DNA-binding domain-containing protein [Acidithiobacillaceae bacterium]MBU2748823.1 AbrB/MazE/SpoVT family DNA-binding domain-containing protein [Acidithiobacillus montserratensis]